MSAQSVGKIIIIILSFRVGTSKNRIKETCSIMSTQVTFTSLYCHLFTNRQVLHDLLEINKYISQLANYGHIEKTRFFFKLLLILPIHKLARKRDTLFVTNSSIKPKVPHSFTTSRSARLYT